MWKPMEKNKTASVSTNSINNKDYQTERFMSAIATFLQDNIAFTKCLFVVSRCRPDLGVETVLQWLPSSRDTAAAVYFLAIFKRTSNVSRVASSATVYLKTNETTQMTATDNPNSQVDEHPVKSIHMPRDIESQDHGRESMSRVKREAETEQLDIPVGIINSSGCVQEQVIERYVEYRDIQALGTLQPWHLLSFGFLCLWTLFSMFYIAFKCAFDHTKKKNRSIPPSPQPSMQHRRHSSPISPNQASIPIPRSPRRSSLSPSVTSRGGAKARRNSIQSEKSDDSFTDAEQF